MDKSEAIVSAEFSPTVVRYYLLKGTLVAIGTGILIPLLPLWWIFGPGMLRRYLKSISCRLTEGSLKVDRGVFNRVEKTIPLDKITDMAYYQGPLMRFFDLEGLKVETAGGSVGPGSDALVNLWGLVDARKFRDQVLAQRDANSKAKSGHTMPVAEQASDAEFLRDIRDSLLRIEAHLSKADD